MIEMSDHSIIKDQRHIPKQVFIDKRNLYDLEAKAWIRGASIAKDFNPNEHIKNMKD